MALGEIGDSAHHGALGVGLVIPRLRIVVACYYVSLSEHRERTTFDLNPVRVMVDQTLEVGKAHAVVAEVI